MDTPDTVTIGRTTYRVERKRLEQKATVMHGYLHGARGAIGMVVQARATGNVLVIGISHLRRMTPADLRRALEDVFDFRPAEGAAA